MTKDKWEPTEEELTLWRDRKNRPQVINVYRGRVGHVGLVQVVELFEARTGLKLRTQGPVTFDRIEELLYAGVFGTNSKEILIGGMKMIVNSKEILIGGMKIIVAPNGSFVALIDNQEVKGRFKIVFE